MPAWAEPVVVIAGHLSAVAVEMDADRAAPAAARAGTAMAVWWEVTLVDGAVVMAHLPLEGYAVAQKPRSVPELLRLAGSAPPDSLGRSIALVAAGTPR